MGQFGITVMKEATGKGHEPWICKLPGHKHDWCARAKAQAPARDCFCHDCEQHRRQNVKRQTGRWVDEALR